MAGIERWRTDPDTWFRIWDGGDRDELMEVAKALGPAEQGGLVCAESRASYFCTREPHPEGTRHMVCNGISIDVAWPGKYPPTRADL